MKYFVNANKKLSSFVSLVAVCVSLPSLAHAERIRSCSFALTADVETQDALENPVREATIAVAGQTTGQHPRVQANTARARARNEVRSCVSSWISLDANLSSADIDTCVNSINGTADFRDETDSRTVRQVIADEFRGLCSSRSSRDEVQIRLSNVTLLTAGGNRCASDVSFPDDEILLGAFCEGLDD